MASGVLASGLLIWGQSGEYDAVDDRAVIGVGTQGAPGVLIPPIITAGGGLNVNLDRFAAAVGCDDGTVAVCESTDQVVIAETAGPSSGSRIDQIWLRPDPDNAIWNIQLATAAETVGWPGLSLGTITMPAGANTVTAPGVTFTQVPNNFGWIRAFNTSAARKQFMSQLGAWGRGWGSFSVTEDVGSLDIGNGALSGWEMFYHPAYPGFLQSGVANNVPTNSAGVATVNFPIAYNPPPAPPPVVVMTGGIYHQPNFAVPWAITNTGFEVCIYRYDGQAMGNQAPGAFQIYWMARGQLRTDTFT